MGPTPQQPLVSEFSSKRERSGKTRAVLGGLVGKSAEWAKAVGKGRLLPPRLPMLDRLAVAHKVSLADLVGTHEAQIHVLAGPGHDALPAVSAALNEYTIVPEGEPEPLDDLEPELHRRGRPGTDRPTIAP
jgi:hypothetical protein